MCQTFQEYTRVTTQIHENILNAFNFSSTYVQDDLPVGMNYDEGKVWAMLCKQKIHMSLYTIRDPSSLVVIYYKFTT